MRSLTSLSFQFVKDRQSVVHKTYPPPAFEIDSVDDEDVRISLLREQNYVNCTVYFKKLCMELTMRHYIRGNNIHYIDYDIFVPKSICLRSVGHLGSCTNDNFKSTENERE